jgi:hypothetical protein
LDAALADKIDKKFFLLSALEFHCTYENKESFSKRENVCILEWSTVHRPSGSFPLGDIYEDAFHSSDGKLAHCMSLKHLYEI